MFYDPGCPYCIYFLDRIKDIINQAIPPCSHEGNQPIRGEEEVKRRGAVSFCIANAKPIESSFFDVDDFKDEVKRAFEE